MIDTLVKSLPPKVKNWLLVAILSGAVLFLTASADSWYPPRLIAPLQSQVNALTHRVDGIEQNQKNQYARIERFLCLQNRQNAELSGMDCSAITPR